MSAGPGSARSAGGTPANVARAMTAGLDHGELAQLETICLKLARPPAAPMAARDTNEVLIT